MNIKSYRRITECPNNWWTKGKVYTVTYRCGKPRLTDDEGAFMFIEDCNLEYLRTEFEKLKQEIYYEL